jgi:hypothetical protein
VILEDNMKRPIRRPNRDSDRRASVTVEMALVLPIFVALIAGIAEASRLLETQNTLATVAREGARLAAMDRTDVLQPNQTTNQKIEADVKNFLDACGLDGDEASVFIVNPNDHTTIMDLDDPDTELELFELRVELPYSSVCGLGTDGSLNLVSKIVFRNAPATYAQ